MHLHVANTWDGFTRLIFISPIPCKSAITGIQVIHFSYSRAQPSVIIFLIFLKPYQCTLIPEWTNDAGMVGALTNESATSKAVYFAHCTSEMIYITHLLAENPERLAGPLLADTYVTLLKGRNAWYGQKLASGELKIEVGDSITGKGMIQVSHNSTCLK